MRYILDSFEEMFFVIISLNIINLVRVIFTYKTKRKFNFVKEVGIALLITYLLILINVVFLPLNIHFEMVTTVKGLSNHVSIVPLKSIIKEFSDIGIAYDGDIRFHTLLILRNVIGNLVLLMPFGFLGGMILDRAKSFSKVLATGILISLSIEVIQLIMSIIGVSYRIFDIDDILLNTIGFTVGYYVFVLLANIAVKVIETNKKNKVINTNEV